MSAAENSGNGNGEDTPNRATTALVSEQVKSLRAATEAGFANQQRATELGFLNVQRQLDNVAGLPEKVARLEERQGELARTVKHLERTDEQRQGRSSDWWRNAFPLLVVGVLATIANVVISLAIH